MNPYSSIFSVIAPGVTRPVKRAAGAGPATGSAAAHEAEQKTLLAPAFAAGNDS
ncbi:MAG: hypothetical protein HY234_14835 [Acidobacteria bacterium]|nr:hypothetical protein [Acidobacteriota bacterium]